IVATCGLTNLAVRGALFSHDWHSAAKVGAINSITQNSADDFIRLFDELKANPAKWNAVDVELRLKLERFYEYVKGAKAQAAASINLITRIENLGLLTLKSEINLLQESEKIRFFDDFSGASDEALRIINQNTSIITYWKTTANIIKARSYNTSLHRSWELTKSEIISRADPTELKILEAIENAPPPSNSQVALAGAYSPDLGGNVVIKYNDIGFNTSTLEPELKIHISYLSLIKMDLDNGGNLYQKLYTNISHEKLLVAGDVGKHAEVIAVNEVIKQMKVAGKFSGLQDLNKIHVLVKGRPAYGNMCRCPHCFHITNGVKMIGNQ
ncbi:MAG: hypothetical protein IM607_12360, partial [Cytophagales bacterium]|nr:hypothetical protein [Cytophagales bacterium]